MQGWSEACGSRFRPNPSVKVKAFPKLAHLEVKLYNANLYFRLIYELIAINKSTRTV